jgi:hypothetical protein
VSTKIRWLGWLESEQLERLKVVADREKTSVAWAVRRAVDIAYPAAKGSKR